LTVSCTVVECESVPLVPLIVRVDAPVEVFRFVVTLIVEVDAVLEGEKEALVRLGSPLADSDTVPEKPFLGVIVTV
jgi:hypothetical protein